MGADTVIREAAAGEVEAVKALLATAYGEYAEAFPPATWRSYLADITDVDGRLPDSTLLVAVDHGQDLVGTVTYYAPGHKASYARAHGDPQPWPPEWASMRLLAVAPHARGRGVARDLTAACLDRARADAAVAMGVHTTDAMVAARRLYAALCCARVPAYDFRPDPATLVAAYRLPLGAP